LDRSWHWRRFVGKSCAPLALTFVEDILRVSFVYRKITGDRKILLLHKRRSDACSIDRTGRWRLRVSLIEKTFKCSFVRTADLLRKFQHISHECYVQMQASEGLTWRIWHSSISSHILTSVWLTVLANRVCRLHKTCPSYALQCLSPPPSVLNQLVHTSWHAIVNFIRSFCSKPPPWITFEQRPITKASIRSDPICYLWPSMSLPPERISIKRRRQEEPVETLCEARQIVAVYHQADRSETLKITTPRTSAALPNIASGESRTTTMVL